MQNLNKITLFGTPFALNKKKRPIPSTINTYQQRGEHQWQMNNNKHAERSA